MPNIQQDHFGMYSPSRTTYQNTPKSGFNENSKTVRSPNTLNSLVRLLDEALPDPSVPAPPLSELTSLLSTHYLEPKDWLPHASLDSNTVYTRNLISSTPTYTLLLLVWPANVPSPIHDHASAHCLMRFLSGQLTEEIFRLPTTPPNPSQPETSEKSDHAPELIKLTTYNEGETAYIADSIGVHRVKNSGTDHAVSLHLYTPPYARLYGCNLFDEVTGRVTKVGGEQDCGNT